MKGIVFIVLFAIAGTMTFGRLWWVNSGGGLSGSVAKVAIPEISSHCASLNDHDFIDYKFNDDGSVGFQCSLWSGSFPAWPLVESFSLAVIPKALKNPSIYRKK